MKLVLASLALSLIIAAGAAVVDSPASVREQIVAGVDLRTGVAEPFNTDCLSRFLDYPPGPGKLGFPRCLLENPFPANPDFWLKGVDFSCASPWNDSYGRLRAGTAISKRHVIFAKHFPLVIGTRVAFVGVNGDISHYTIKATKALADCDIMIGLLDFELTPDVHPAKVLPADYPNYIEKLEGLPVVTLNQDECAVLSEMKPTYTNAPSYMLDDFRQPETPVRKRFNVKIRGGDSGSPTFLICGGEPILLFCQTTSIGGYGLHRFRREIQKAMDELCPGYKLDDVDLASICKQQTSKLL